MNKKLITMGVLAAALQLGCSSMQGFGVESKFAKPDLPPCDTNADCRITVYATIDASQQCVVQLLYGKITVAKVRHPKVVWRLEKADPDGDNFHYRFKPEVGIVIVGNDPSKDFDDPGYDNGNDHRFKVRSKNLRKKAFEYEVTCSGA